MSRDDFFWWFSQGKEYIANNAINMKQRMEDCVTVRGTEQPNTKPRTWCFCGAPKWHQPITEELYITHTWTALGPVLHGARRPWEQSTPCCIPPISWGLAALCRPRQVRDPSGIHHQVGGKQEITEGFAIASVSPHLHQAAVSRWGNNSWLHLQAKQTFSLLHSNAAH